jgi:predicted transposase YdaD
MTSPESQRIDHDYLFKELISNFFWEFLELFLPEVAAYADKNSLTLLPQEIFSDISTGQKREVDLLAKVKFRETDTVFLIHLENQSYTEAAFAERMFTYFAYLFLKYRLPIYPVVIFSFDKPKRLESNNYQVNFPDCQILSFNYLRIQLNNLNWREYLKQANPIAAGLMAKMAFKPEERVKVKLECLRMIASLKLDPARTELISGFIDTYLRLNEQEEIEFQTELKSLGRVEEEKVMEIVTSWMEKGIEQGRQQGETSLVIRQLKRRLGEITANQESQIENLPLDVVESLAFALLDFQTSADLDNWLAAHP